MIDKIGDLELYVGNADDSRSLPHLQQYSINSTVNVAVDWDAPNFKKMKHCKIGLIDGGSHNQPWEYVVAATIVKRLLARGDHVLLHCISGVSRSPAVAVVVVASGLDGDVDAAVSAAHDEVVKKYRKCTGILPGHWPHIRKAVAHLRDGEEL